jgi:hypothetical protein
MSRLLQSFTGTRNDNEGGHSCSPYDTDSKEVDCTEITMGPDHSLTA